MPTLRRKTLLISTANRSEVKRAPCAVQYLLLAINGLSARSPFFVRVPRLGETAEPLQYQGLFTGIEKKEGKLQKDCMDSTQSVFALVQSSSRLVGEFVGYGHCMTTFDTNDEQGWIEHIVHDHLVYKLSTHCICWFCDHGEYSTETNSTVAVGRAMPHRCIILRSISGLKT
ncbi:hypothetical protein BGZ61DRAFT_444060 [Ilyonectria robusta]|uniref:uncharacterized protein n=1 Tax=Ilyonectria robusta TaxID=1079257 RepID=UPI001E8D436A|nr:uncharacterized protein BGZ61DRAFT_444060 [Ilyonectria robusta]KAH8735315.1 hypothetical protein BGZ61DRAFT_444060 [Ilyonectria robusta]